MNLTYYLPAIVILIFIAAIVVAGISIAKERQREKRGMSVCYVEVYLCPLLEGRELYALDL